jgi:hypothetical protein
MPYVTEQRAAMRSAEHPGASDEAQREVVADPRRSRLAFFALGLACAGFMGAVALGLLTALGPPSARANTHLRLAQLDPFAIVRVFHQFRTSEDVAALAASLAPAADLVIERRVWWKLPVPGSS